MHTIANLLLALPLDAQAVAFLQANATDSWSPLINFLTTLLRACGGLGFVIGVALKATAGVDEGRHQLSHKLMGGTLAGLVIGLLAPDLYDLFFGWTGG